MKTGKSIIELAQALDAQKKQARDFIVPVEKLQAVTVTKDDGREHVALNFANGSDHTVRPNTWAHSQLATYSDIPKAYYDRLNAENPRLLTDNINHSFERLRYDAKTERKQESRMLRTVGHDVRAVLSSKYRRLDAHDLIEAVLPVMIDGQFEVESSELTERRIYLKALTPKVQGEVKVGDVVQFGLMVSSSDVGAGSLRVEPLLYRLVCKNGMVTNSALKKFHIGRNQGTDDITELLSDRTKELTDAAFWASIRDVVQANMRPDIFQRELDRMKEAAGIAITNFNLEQVAELAMDRVGVTGEKTRMSIVEYLARGADGAGLNKWGLANAFTYAAQADHVDYDESIELERAGAKVIELQRKDWAAIAEKTA